MPALIGGVLVTHRDALCDLPWSVTIDLKRLFFEDLLAVDPVAEIVRFANPLLVIDDC